MADLPEECPNCGRPTRRHCDSPTCRWWSCTEGAVCRHYGDAKGRSAQLAVL